MTPKFTHTVGIAVSALGLLCMQAKADEGALYAEAAPADAVFVRVLEQVPSQSVEFEFDGKSIAFEQDVLNTYVPISASSLTSISQGGMYSVVIADDGSTKIIEEPQRDTASKVHLILVNAGTSPVRLIVPGRGMEVVATLEGGQAASRAVNPIEVELAVERVEDGEILNTFDVSLARGQNLTFVAQDDNARLVENTFGPVQHVK